MEVAQLAAEEVPEVAADEASLRHLLRKRKDSGPRLFRRTRRALRQGLRARPLMEGHRRGAHQSAQLPRRRRSRSRRRHARPTPRPTRREGHRRGSFAENGRVRPGACRAKRPRPIWNTASATSKRRPSRTQSLDLAILSQALHHAEHPQRAIDAAFRILKPGGRLIVLDLRPAPLRRSARTLRRPLARVFRKRSRRHARERAGFTDIETVVADRETTAPNFQTLLGIGVRPDF